MSSRALRLRLPLVDAQLAERTRLLDTGHARRIDALDTAAVAAVA